MRQMNAPDAHANPELCVRTVATIALLPSQQYLSQQA